MFALPGILYYNNKVENSTPQKGEAAVKREQRSLADQAYEKIKKKILSLEFLPGQVVSDFKLQQELEMSRTPIKEALMSLENDGLILDLGKRGYEVRRITAQDVVDLFDARAGIECAGLTIAMDRGMSEAAMKKLRSLNEQVRLADEAGDYEGVFDHDSELHVTMMEASGNRRLNDYYRTILLQVRRIRLLTYFEKSLPGVAVQLHAHMFDAIEQGRRQEALDLLRQHILDTKNDYLRVMEQSIHDDADFAVLRYLIRNNLKVTENGTRPADGA